LAAQETVMALDRHALILGCNERRLNLRGDVGERNPVNRRDGQYSNGELKGWEIGEIVVSDGRKLPRYAYGSEKFVFYWGWQPTGFGGLKLNRWSLLLAPLASLLFGGLVLPRILSNFGWQPETIRPESG
jgi:hypothetical protein